jgi:hypothetical protein
VRCSSRVKGQFKRTVRSSSRVKGQFKRTVRSGSRVKGQFKSTVRTSSRVKGQFNRTVRDSSRVKGQFNRTVRDSSRVKGQFKGRSSSNSEKAVGVGVQEPSEPSRLVAPRRVRPVGPRGIQGTVSQFLVPVVEDCNGSE